MDERYPIGQFIIPESIGDQQLNDWLNEIESLPRRLNQTVRDLTEQQLASTYRTNGWTVRQIVHHLADSHMNSYLRMKLAVTEDQPTIKTYDEKEWAKQADYNLDIDVSLNLLAALHLRWVHFLKNLEGHELQRGFIYPDGSQLKLEEAIGVYAWHGAHHLAHIENALRNK